MSRINSLLACGFLLGLASSPGFAQDSAFLACDRYSDRAERIACLEDALEAATAAEQNAAAGAAPVPAAPQASSPAPVTAPPAARAAPPVAPAPAAPVAAEAAVAPADAENDPSLLERLRNFGRETVGTLTTDAEGQDQLHDTIARLEKRRDLWIVTLANGQVWTQDYPRTLNLREGDEVTIYQAGIGDGYRLSTERLSGFIRVKRAL
jgi:hypothetical protein